MILIKFNIYFDLKIRIKTKSIFSYVTFKKFQSFRTDQRRFIVTKKIYKEIKIQFF
jgi:hypothetical protein